MTSRSYYNRTSLCIQKFGKLAKSYTFLLQFLFFVLLHKFSTVTFTAASLRPYDWSNLRFARAYFLGFGAYCSSLESTRSEEMAAPFLTGTGTSPAGATRRRWWGVVQPCTGPPTRPSTRQTLRQLHHPSVACTSSGGEQIGVW